jgi:hypothetical protein
MRAYDVVLEATRVADAYGLVSVDGVRYSIPSQHARRAVLLQCRPERLTFIVAGEIVAQHAYAAHGIRLVQNPEHLPPRPQPQHERFAKLGEVINSRLGESGRRYVAAVEQKAPHAPLALLREVLARADEYGVATVTAAIDSLLQFSIIKRGTLSTLCHRFGGTPRIVTSAPASFPNVDVEQRPLSVYDGAVA